MAGRVRRSLGYAAQCLELCRLEPDEAASRRARARGLHARRTFRARSSRRARAEPVRSGSLAVRSACAQKVIRGSRP